MKKLLNMVFENRSEPFKVIEENKETIKIIFLKTNATKTVRRGRQLRYIKDFYNPMHFEKGFIGEGIYSEKENPKIYDTWRNMLKRCYDVKSIKYKFYGEKGVFVSERWLNFQNFAKDTKQMKNSYIEGYQLDKDIKIKGNLEYCMEKCSFVKAEENLKESMREQKIKVICLKTKKETFYDSISEAARQLNLQTANINKVLRGIRKHHKNFSFERVE